MYIQIIKCRQEIPNHDERISLMSHRLYNKGVVTQKSSQIVWNFSHNLGFDMTSAYQDLFFFYANELDFNCYGHMLQAANEHEGIGVRPASANLVSNQH